MTFIYLCLTGIYFLCTISSSVCDICLTCVCSTTIVEESIINCHGKHLENNDMLNFDLLTLDEQKALNKLILSKNNIVNLSEPLLKKLKRLKILDLSENLIEVLYTRVFTDLNDLEDLNLSKNALVTFDDTLLEVLPALSSLNLSHNHIHTIEHRINKAVTMINFLDLSHNNISNLPNNIFESLLSLQYLDLSFNKINSLKDNSLKNLDYLKAIYLNNNFLTSLDIQIFPKSLLELYSGYNLIREVTYETSEIEVLNLEYNQISEIQINITALNHLTHLNVCGNKLSNFPRILLKNLKTLDISYNELPRIPETLSIENVPLLVHLNVSKNPIEHLKFLSDLNLRTFIASNLSMLQAIDKDAFARLNALSKDCIDLTVSNNKQLSYIHEEILEHMHLCSLDLSNNQLAYLSQKLIAPNNSSETYNINLQGNPFKCNCSLQWMLNDLVPKLYSAQPTLLNNLRCAWPPHVSNMRMVHWYGWKDQVFCNNTLEFNEDLTVNMASVLNNQVVTFDSSPGLLAALGTAIAVLSILVILGLIMTQRLIIKKRRINRKF